MESRRMAEMFRLHAKSDGTVKDIVESHQRDNNHRKSRHTSDAIVETVLTESQVREKDARVLEILEEHFAGRPLSFGR